MDAKVGGTYKMSFMNFTTGKSISFGDEYRELVRNERLRYTDNFDDPNLPGEIQVTVTLERVSVGTELNIVQEGLPAVIPLEACYLGWQENRYGTWQSLSNQRLTTNAINTTQRKPS